MLHVTIVIARERETGNTVCLSLAGSLTGGLRDAGYSRLHEAFRANSEEGRALRAKYSHALFYLDNQLVQSYELPAPGKSARARLEKQLDAARAELADKQAKLAEVRGVAESLQQTVAAADAAEARVASLEVELGLRPAAVEVTDPDDDPDPDDELLASRRAELEASTVPQLVELCKASGIDVSALKKKDELIHALLLSA